MSHKIPAKDLKDLFISTFKDEKSFKYEAGNPFLMKLKGKEYYVFLKNISSAYYKKYPDNARIQLPFSPHFKKISKSNFDFIILGYDSEFQTFSAWDPRLIKARLNVRGNVSLFTRFSFQKKCKLNEFKEHHISDGGEVILFSIKSTPIYFTNFKSLYKNQKVKSDIYSKITTTTTEISDMGLTYKKNKTLILDKNISTIINDFKKKNDLIGAVLFCFEYYKNKSTNNSINYWTKQLSVFFTTSNLH